LIFLLLLIGGAAYAIVFGAQNASDASHERARVVNEALQRAREIDGITSGSDSSMPGGKVVDDDGQVGNPKKYATSSKLHLMYIDCIKFYLFLNSSIY